MAKGASTGGIIIFSMDYQEALTKLVGWCEQSRGTLIEICPGVYQAFESERKFTRSDIEALEASLKWTLPNTYTTFLEKVGEGQFFLNEEKLGLNFFSIPRILDASSTLWEGAEKQSIKRLCIIGEYERLGDYFGFHIDQDSENFDVFSHEYPPEEYVQISDELDSWTTFEDWIVKVVSSFGNDII